MTVQVVDATDPVNDLRELLRGKPWSELLSGRQEPLDLVAEPVLDLL